MIPSVLDFSSAIINANLSLNALQVTRAAQFAHILHRENQKQNLTRILGVGEFIEGHLLDSIQLLAQPTLGLSVADIGSGSGVPGLLSAAIDLEPNRVWFLVESELGKAEYLEGATAELGLKNVFVKYGRADQMLKGFQPDTVTARAVGVVEKIANWIWNCSTWNNLILFKSRGWSEEWAQAQKAPVGKKLTVTHSADYSDSTRTRLLISLSRLPK